MVNLKIRQWYLVPIAVFVLGVISIVMLLWIHLINERQRLDFCMSSNLSDIQNLLSSSHLWLEEAIGGNQEVEVQKIKDDIDLAINLAEAVLIGGKSEHGEQIEPIKDSRWRESAEQIKLLLIKFKLIALKRLEVHDKAGIGSSLDKDLDKDFNSVYREIQSKADDLEMIVEKEQLRNRTNWRYIFLSSLLAWVGIVSVSAIGIFTYELKRRTAEKALQQANEQLKAQTEELEEHRGRLTELVKGRTAELTFAVRSLEDEIAERKQTEQSLRASENRFRTLVENLPQRICLKDKSSVYLYCNDKYAQALNVRSDEILGKTDYDFYPKELAEKHIAEDNKVLNSGKIEWIEERHVKDGQEEVVQKIKLPIKSEKGEMSGILDIFWDITEKIRLESIAEAVTMMNNIGYIFAGIRHEIGNPINSAKITLSVLQKKIDTYSKEAMEEYIERAIGEISSVENLLKTLKSFNMYETPELQNIEIKPFMDKFLSLLSDDLEKRGIAIQIFFQPEAQWGYADPRALQQIMLNIMNNASNAVEGKKNPRILIKVSKGDNTIRIKVTDNGGGMSEDQQKRLFTPFFTTKASGTGLGLVIAKKLLSKMDGTIKIESQPDEGTSVDISIRERR